METKTRYAYEKRIKELEQEAQVGRGYRRVCLDIFSVVTDQVQAEKQISRAWILSKIGEMLK